MMDQRQAIGWIRKVLRTVSTTVAVSVVLTACALTYDKQAELERADYEGLVGRRGPSQQAQQEPPPIPGLEPILAAPTPPEVADMRRVSVSVTDTTPLRDVLIELARKAGVDLELDSRIRGGIIFTAHDRPFREVVERIAELAKLRFSLTNNVLRIETDDAYLKSYRLDALNLVRSASSSVQTSTDVFAAIGSSSAAGNGSSSSVESNSSMDFWKELETNLTQILTSSQIQADQANAQTVSTASAADIPVDTTQQAADQLQQGLAGATGDTAATDAAAATGTTTATAPAQDTATATPTASTSSNSTYFSINKQAALVTVFATQRQHKLVQEYLKELRTATRNQVLIEAKIVEVTLTDQFRAGINWNHLTNASIPLNPAITANLGRNIVSAPTTDTEATLSLSYAFKGLDIAAALNLIDTFGTVRTLSSPRLTVMNNQTAVLKVAENQVYFTVEVETTTESGITNTTYTSTMNTVPIGLVMTVQPFINSDTKEVTLNLRPTVSRIADTIADPAVTLQNANVESLIPVVEVREMDSVVTIDDGEVVVMGGLMQERRTGEQEGLPGLKDLPLFGRAFRADTDRTDVVELVIFLRATIVRGRDSVTPADRDIYNRFAPDPRPIVF